MQRIFSLGFLLASLPAWAEDTAMLTAKAGEPPVSHGPDNLVSMLSLGLGLVAVIALIFMCAWLVKRMTGLTGMNNQAMKIVSVLAVGARERIALVDVGGTQILVGITPSAIRTLHVFDEPVVTQGGSPADSDFAKRLQAMVGRHWQGKSATDSPIDDDPRGGPA
ncbi:flagellar biosynthetic protein FliO [Marinobacter sp. 1Y8]